MRVHSPQGRAGRLSVELSAAVVTHSLASCDIAGSTEHFWTLNLEPSPRAVALKHPTQPEGSCQAGRHPRVLWESLRPSLGTAGTR